MLKPLMVLADVSEFADKSTTNSGRGKRFQVEEGEISLYLRVIGDFILMFGEHDRAFFCVHRRYCSTIYFGQLCVKSVGGFLVAVANHHQLSAVS